MKRQKIRKVTKKTYKKRIKRILLLNPYGMSKPKILKVKDEFKLSISFNNFKYCRFTVVPTKSEISETTVHITLIHFFFL